MNYQYSTIQLLSINVIEFINKSVFFSDNGRVQCDRSSPADDKETLADDILCFVSEKLTLTPELEENEQDKHHNDKDTGQSKTISIKEEEHEPSSRREGEIRCPGRGPPEE